jgi:hypothetical protein
MNYRFGIIALIGLGVYVPTCVAQSMLTNSPEEIAEKRPALDTPKESPAKRSPGAACEGHLDNANKADCFAHRFFGTGTLIGPLFMAGPEFAKPPAGYPKDWRRGPAGFGRLYGDALAFETVQQTTRFVTGLALHEDLRYIPSDSRNPLRRTIHAMAFAAFDRSDSGKVMPAASNFLSSAAAGFVGNAYLPRGYEDTSHAVTRMGFQFGSIIVTNLVTEFKPELHYLGKMLHLPTHLGCSHSAR